MHFQLSFPHFSVGILLILGLSACDSQHPESTQQAQTPPSYEADEQPAVDEGMSLTKVAGQASLPYSETQVRNLTQPSEASLGYVGRYHARIPCTDPFAGCVNLENEAEYILNLLEDGSVYWTNTSFGRLGIDTSRNVTKIEQLCNQVQWYAHEAQNEIIVRCDAANISFYYQVNQDGNLVLDLDKLWHGNNGENQIFFSEYPFPKKAYVFKRVS